MAPTTATNDATRKLLAQLWEKNLPVLRERLNLLETVATEGDSLTLSTERRRQAAQTAHKLAGSLGMFGYPEGTALARKLEVFFDGEAPSDIPEGGALAQVRRLRAELGLS